MVRRWTVALLVPAGLWLTHVVSYGVAHGADASTTLATSGHAYLPGLLVVGLLAVCGAGLMAVAAGPRLALPSRRLAGIQTGVFLATEILERLPAGGRPVAAVAAEPAVWLGLVLAATCGVAMSAVLGAIARRAPVGSVALASAIPGVVGGRPLPQRLHHVDPGDTRPILRRGPPAVGVA